VVEAPTCSSALLMFQGTNFAYHIDVCRSVSMFHINFLLPSQRTGTYLVKNESWAPGCDGTSQVIRATYSCPCPTDIRHPVDVPKSLDKFGIFPYLTRNDSPVLQTLQNIGDKELRKRLHNLHLFKKQAQVVLLQTRTKSEC
jgi:hypothetical protein